MGFLDNSTITVDAILTKRGRQILSQGGNFNITKFALSDEEIDYTLYDVTHPNGTDSYGAAIENMSLLEASPNRRLFNSHLVNQSLAGAKVEVAQLSYTGVATFAEIVISPTTIGAPAEDYTFTIDNINVVKFKATPSAKTRTGKVAKIVAQSITIAATTTVTVIGVSSGITNIITMGVKKDEGSTSDPLGPENNGENGGGGGCFIAGTKIQMPNGIKFIEDITVGDMVKSFDTGTSSVVNSKVTETFVHSDRYYMILNENIKTTSVHPFYSDGNWIEAGDLSIGDKILHVDGLEHTIETIELSDEPVTVYNFEVDGTHNYFAEDYLVHNKVTENEPYL